MCYYSHSRGHRARHRPVAACVSPREADLHLCALGVVVVVVVSAVTVRAPAAICCLSLSQLARRSLGDCSNLRPLI